MGTDDGLRVEPEALMDMASSLDDLAADNISDAARFDPRRVGPGASVPTTAATSTTTTVDIAATASTAGVATPGMAATAATVCVSTAGVAATGATADVAEAASAELRDIGVHTSMLADGLREAARRYTDADDRASKRLAASAELRDRRPHVH